MSNSQGTARDTLYWWGLSLPSWLDSGTSQNPTQPVAMRIALISYQTVFNWTMRIRRVQIRATSKAASHILLGIRWRWPYATRNWLARHYFFRLLASTDSIQVPLSSGSHSCTIHACVATWVSQVTTRHRWAACLWMLIPSPLWF